MNIRIEDVCLKCNFLTKTCCTYYRKWLDAIKKKATFASNK